MLFKRINFVNESKGILHFHFHYNKFSPNTQRIVVDVVGGMEKIIIGFDRKKFLRNILAIFHQQQQQSSIVKPAKQ